MLTKTRKKLIATAAGLALLVGAVFGMQGASGVETTGVVYQCASVYTGAVRVVYNPNQCTGQWIAYEMEGERWIPTPTPAAP